MKKKTMTLAEWIEQDKRTRLYKAEQRIKEQHRSSNNGKQSAKFFDEGRKLVRTYTSKLKELQSK